MARCDSRRKLRRLGEFDHFVVVDFEATCSEDARIYRRSSLSSPRCSSTPPPATSSPRSAPTCGRGTTLASPRSARSSRAPGRTRSTAAWISARRRQEPPRRRDVGRLGLPDHAGVGVPLQGPRQAGLLRPVGQPPGPLRGGVRRRAAQPAGGGQGGGPAVGRPPPLRPR
uniref:Exonuclease domain-containing protein n=1 Tax=Arundo donax TaxID=35708 RepID=A0A0A9G9D6_ARUDO